MSQRWNNKKRPQKQKIEELKYPTEDFFAQKGKKEGNKEAMEVVKTVGKKKLNFRELPSKEARILKVLDPGAKVTVLEDGAEWSKVRRGNLVGYVMTEFIE